MKESEILILEEKLNPFEQIETGKLLPNELFLRHAKDDIYGVFTIVGDQIYCLFDIEGRENAISEVLFGENEILHEEDDLQKYWDTSFKSLIFFSKDPREKSGKKLLEQLEYEGNNDLAVFNAFAIATRIILFGKSDDVIHEFCDKIDVLEQNTQSKFVAPRLHLVFTLLFYHSKEEFKTWTESHSPEDIPISSPRELLSLAKDIWKHYGLKEAILNVLNEENERYDDLIEVCAEIFPDFSYIDDM